MRPRRHFSLEQKKEVVAHMLAGRMPKRQILRDANITQSAAMRWQKELAATVTRELREGRRQLGPTVDLTKSIEALIGSPIP